MPALKEAVNDFLAQKRIAVAGVSRSPNQAANLIYRTLRSRGYEVFAVNPKADQVEGDTSYHDLKSIPGGVEGVVVATAPTQAPDVVRECAEQGVSRVWLHRSFGAGSVSQEAIDLSHEKGITTIAGGCPMMFIPGADFGHKCMRGVLGLMGRLPKQV